MSDIAIRAENLGKSYQIAHSSGRSGYKTLQEDMLRLLKHPFSKTDAPPKRETFRALKDVSFEVKHGEVLGIIGRNGAGKSTLLKILSRITKPTTGRADIYGRIGSLLEVGTGFHPELTGRENIFLNGAVLGMTRRDIQKHFDEIVAFAEVEQFLDTPVKRYSSGMYMRLAFAVAAHLEPEVLVVDEVLAVGDAKFQEKCLGKMSEVAKAGRTVLFVSHNMAAVEMLCTRGLVLQQGMVSYLGTQTEAISCYIESVTNSITDLSTRQDRQGTGEIRINAIEMRSADSRIIDVALSGQDINFYLFYETLSKVHSQSVVVGIRLNTQLDAPVFLHHSRLTRTQFVDLADSGAFVCRIKRLPLPAGNYRLTYSVSNDDGYIDSLPDAISITVAEGDFYGTGEVPPATHTTFLIDADWRLETEVLVAQKP
jgi:lipopolysaccharide transport system ATP-binding protein